MRQRSFASTEYALKKKRTRREMFLADMERIVQWSRLETVIAPSYPRGGRVGRPPIGLPGYRGVDKREEAMGPTWFVAMQPGKRRALDLTKKWARLLEKAEQLKAAGRAKVEHPFHVVKNLFGHHVCRTAAGAGSL